MGDFLVFIFTVAVVILATLFVISTLIILGKVTLSEQSLIHRKYIIYLFIAAIFIEAFKVKVNFGFLLEFPSDQINMVKGAIAFFSLYSLIEYLISLFKDLLDKDHDKKDAFKSFSYIVIGIPRAIFDILAPIIAGYITIYIFYDDGLSFTITLIEFVQEKLNLIIEGSFIEGYINLITEVVESLQNNEE